jgi:hypothetical protein
MNKTKLPGSGIWKKEDQSLVAMETTSLAAMTQGSSLQNCTTMEPATPVLGRFPPPPPNDSLQTKRVDLNTKSKKKKLNSRDAEQ